MKPTDHPTNGTHVVPPSLGAFNTAQEVPPLPGRKSRPAPPAASRAQEAGQRPLRRPSKSPLETGGVLASGIRFAAKPAEVPESAPAYVHRPWEPEVAEGVDAAPRPRTPSTTQELIVEECRALEALLLEKNEAYGDSALNPLRLFSHASPIEQLKVRIDDKLSRIARGDFAKVKEEDLRVVTKDLLGYLILIRVGWRLGLE
jgi:hypothetical protein